MFACFSDVFIIVYTQLYLALFLYYSPEKAVEKQQKRGRGWEFWVQSFVCPRPERAELLTGVSKRLFF